MENIAPALLDWFYRNRRILPFREDPTPYHVWLSEIMLQQTRVSAALPYYERFLAALPDIPALADVRRKSCTSCGRGWVITAGCATCRRQRRSSAPSTAGSCLLITTPCWPCQASGSTRRGHCSISFGLPVPAVDGNVLRVFARLYNDPRWSPTAGEAGVHGTGHGAPAARKSRRLHQALMELGALVCLPNGAPSARSARWLLSARAALQAGRTAAGQNG